MKLALTILCLILPNFSSAEPAKETYLSPVTHFQLDGRASKVRLRVHHIPMGRFDTEAKNALKGTIKLSKDGTLTADSITLDMNAFQSVISLRDDHMKSKYLKTEQFPIGTLKAMKTKATGAWNPLEGVLQIKDKSVKIEGKAKASVKNHLLHGTFEFKVTITSYDIETPVYMGVGIEPEIDINVDVTAIPEMDEAATLPNL